MRLLPALLLVAVLTTVPSRVRAHGPGGGDADHVHPTTETPEGETEPSADAEEEETGTRTVSFSGRIRLRGLFHSGVGLSGGHEHSSEFVPAHDHEEQARGVLMQVRIGMSWTPYEWLVFHVEGQDAHVFGEGFPEEREAPAEHSNLFDLRKAYVDLHTTLAEAPMRVRIGRQTL
ncbi:MAG: hypothetical protein QF464_08580, partial [Myxococcota bacterium]|nr:hypothetical protein [Myxococcota bacterium]